MSLNEYERYFVLFTCKSRDWLNSFYPFWKLFHEFSPSLVKSAFRLVFFYFSRNMSAHVLDDGEAIYAYGYRCAGATMCPSTGWVDFVFPLGLILNDISDFTRIAGAALCSLFLYLSSTSKAASRHHRPTFTSENIAFNAYWMKP